VSFGVSLRVLEFFKWMWYENTVRNERNGTPVDKDWERLLAAF